MKERARILCNRLALSAEQYQPGLFDDMLSFLKELEESKVWDVAPSAPTSNPAPATEPFTQMTSLIAARKSMPSVKVEVSPDGSCVSVSWHFAPTER